MKKTKEQVRRFLSSVRPATEKDEHLVRLFLNKRKTRIAAYNPDEARSGEREAITYEQFEAWYDTDMPTVGDVVRCEVDGSVGVVVREGWNFFVASGLLATDGKLSFDEHRFYDEKWAMASEEQIESLQRALSAAGVDWNPIGLNFIERVVPQQPKFIRLMEMGRQVGIGIFRDIQPDGTLDMFCVKMGGARLAYSGKIDMGNADGYSFFETYDEHRAIVQEELGEDGYIWNPKCRRIQKNNARAKVGKSYFWVTAYLDIRQSVESDSAGDRKRFNRGNYFLRREVAVRARYRALNACKEEMMSEDNCSDPL